MWAKNLRTETTGRTAKAVTEDDSDFMGNFEEELTDIADEIVDRIVESNLDRIPNMFARALNRRLRDGSVRGAFHVWEERVTKRFISGASEEERRGVRGLPGLPFSDEDTVDTSATEMDDEEEDN